ncbi:MAG: FAD:protein FMN transferase [Erysipelotrichaceae bacterium]|nr:FAD:protein FMN transferase [Erysipelotrichaceae bacterium]
MYRTKLLALLFVLLLFFGCGKKEAEKYSYWLPPITDESGEMVLLLNTEVRLTVIDSAKGDGMQTELNETVIHFHQLLDPHHYYSADGERINNLKVINDSYGTETPVKVDPDLIDALEESFVLAELTEGYFNPTVGRLSDLWTPRFSSKEHYDSDPDAKEIEEALACQLEVNELRETIEIDQTNSTVTFHKNDRCSSSVRIDLGAFTKGYVLDRAYEKLISHETSFLIDGGSSSVITYAKEGEDPSWTIGILSPDTDSMLFAFKADNTALSTSGDYERYFLTADTDGHVIRRHHILDPFTGYSRNLYRSISLASDKNAGVLDALSTALFSMPQDQQTRVIRNIEKQYDMKIEKSLLLQEEKQLVMQLDPSFRNRLLNDLISSELKKIVTTAE